MTTQLQDKFRALEADLQSIIFERREEIHTMVLALLGGQHWFALGSPGIAKSLLIEQMVKRIGGLSDEEFMNILLTRYSQPEEVFGAPNVKALTEGRYERVTKFMLPEAKIAFLDEIFKANSAILNALLRAMNERRFRNGSEDAKIPLMSLFAASNELMESDELAAMWDRLHFRHHIQPIRGASEFIAMLNLELPDDTEKIVTLDDIAQAQTEIEKITIPEEVFLALLKLKADLLDENIFVTDRRWREAIRAIKCETWYNGRNITIKDDTRPLKHMLWSDVDHLKVVFRIVGNLADPLEQEAQEAHDNLRDAYAKHLEEMSACELQRDKTQAVLGFFRKVKKSQQQLTRIEKKMAQSERTTDAVVEWRKTILEYNKYSQKHLAIDNMIDTDEEE